MKLFEQKKAAKSMTDPLFSVKMTVEYTPSSEHPYSLMDGDGKVLLNSNRRRDLVRIMESGRAPKKETD